VYSTVLKNWLQADDKSILNRQAAYLNFV